MSADGNRTDLNGLFKTASKSLLNTIVVRVAVVLCIFMHRVSGFVMLPLYTCYITLISRRPDSVIDVLVKRGWHIRTVIHSSTQ